MKSKRERDKVLRAEQVEWNAVTLRRVRAILREHDEPHRLAPPQIVTRFNVLTGKVERVTL